MISRVYTAARTALASPASTGAEMRPIAVQAKQRDLRLDFFRGLALLFIFIDHVPGNALAHVTMRAFGLSDAAEAFVLIAGFAAMLAYDQVFATQGLWAGAKQVGRRIRELYAAQLLLMAVCAGLLALAARWFENPLYFEHVNLTPFSYDPLGAIWRGLLLYYQLGYINILPLYIVLLASFPALWWLMKRQPYVALGLSTALWLAAGLLGVNLPSWPEVYGWFFNPFAWQLLFTIGAFAALKYRQGATLSRSPWLIAAAATYAVFGFLVAAPWLALPGWHPPRLIPLELLGTISKSSLSPWRAVHILAVAYLIAVLVPASAGWLKTRVSGWIIHCGRNGLDIFCLGTIFSFVGFIVFLEAGRSLATQAIVNGLGVGVMIWAALWLSKRKDVRKVQAAVRSTQQASVTDQAQPIHIRSRS